MSGSEGMCLQPMESIHVMQMIQRTMLREEKYTKARLGDLAVVDDIAGAVHLCE